MAAGAATNGEGPVRAGSTGIATCAGAVRCVIAISRAAAIGMAAMGMGLATVAVLIAATGTAARDLEAVSASAARTLAVRISAFGKMVAKMAAKPIGNAKAARVADVSMDATLAARILL